MVRVRLKMHREGEHCLFCRDALLSLSCRRPRPSQAELFEQTLCNSSQVRGLGRWIKITMEYVLFLVATSTPRAGRCFSFADGSRNLTILNSSPFTHSSSHRMLISTALVRLARTFSMASLCKTHVTSYETLFRVGGTKRCNYMRRSD